MTSTQSKMLERFIFHNRRTRWSYDITKEDKLKCTFCSSTFENLLLFEKHLSTKLHRKNYNQKTKCENPDQIKEWILLCEDISTLASLIKQHNHIIHDVRKHEKVERVLLIVFKDNQDATPYLVKQIMQLIAYVFM
jgi:hypothetical protein